MRLYSHRSRAQTVEFIGILGSAAGTVDLLRRLRLSHLAHPGMALDRSLSV
jgi:hypothetical protein